MAKAITTSRHSLDDRHRPANRSPFRSVIPQRREAAAWDMIAKREEELEMLQAALAAATTAKVRNNLRTRILATTNNLKSWQSYLDGSNERDEECYREPRATQGVN